MRTIKGMEWLAYKVQLHCLGFFILEKKDEIRDWTEVYRTAGKED